MKLSQLYEAISKIPPHIRAQADVGIVLNDHQAVIAGEAWLDAEDQDQFILGVRATNPTAFPVPNSPRRAQTDEPRTALGRKLRELRTAIVASGIKLLTWDDLEHEIDDRRGDSE